MTDTLVREDQNARAGLISKASDPTMRAVARGSHVKGSSMPFVIVAGSEATQWRVMRSNLAGRFAVAFSIDAIGTLELIARERPIALVLCSDLLDMSAEAFLSKLPARDGLRVFVIAPSERASALNSERIAGVRVVPQCQVASLLSQLEELDRGSPRRLGPSADGESPDPCDVDLPAYRPMVIGRTAVMRRVASVLRRVAQVDVNVLINGETGTGKELVARRLHCLSDRARGPFRALNVSAVPDALFESVLFGHERGAFTGAVTQSTGVFEQAHRGTLFLDEISSLALSAQPKLLRAIQEQEIERVGASRPISVDARVVSASNVDLEEALRRREFREDLYHRLSVVVVDIPPLRDRTEDIPLLTEFFLKRYARQFRCEVPELTAATIQALQRHEWTGNIRELENRVQKAILFGSARLTPEDFFSDTAGRSQSRSGPYFGGSDHSLEEIEQAYIEQVLHRTGGNQSKAAEILGIDRKTLRAKIKRTTPVGVEKGNLCSVPLAARESSASEGSA